jgi:hypothetical protein
MAQPTQPYRQNSNPVQQNNQSSAVVNERLMKFSNDIRQAFKSTMIPLLDRFKLVRESDNNPQHNNENYRQTKILIDELIKTLQDEYNVMYIPRGGSSRRRKTVKKRK